MAKLNPALKNIQAALLRQFKKLNDALDDVTDADTADALVREMMEVNHRIALTGGLLFAAQSDELDALVVDVKASTRAVNEALTDIKDLEGLFQAMTGFLTLVDDALDLAKTLML